MARAHIQSRSNHIVTLYLGGFVLFWGAWIAFVFQVFLSCRCDDTGRDRGPMTSMVLGTRNLSDRSPLKAIVEPIQLKPVEATTNISDHVCLADTAARDDLQIGKSCRYETDHWVCRDCGLSGTTPWENCTVMTPDGRCPEFPRVDWDFPVPRSRSAFDPTAFHHSTRNILSWYDTEEFLEQIPCDMEDDFCFDLSRCSDDGKIAVYAHKVFGNSTVKSLGEQYVSRAAELCPDKIRQVLTPESACLLVVTCDAYQNFTDLLSSEAWNQGQNTYVFQSNHCFDAHPGRSFGGAGPYDEAQAVNFAKAAIATSSLTDVMLRKGYDIPLARVRGLFHTFQKEFAVSKDLPALAARPANRRWLLTFKGQICAHWPHPWWHHRWLAYEYWNTTSDPDVAIDGKCTGRIRYAGKPYTEDLDYNELLLNATFAFCPGGMSVNSFRFAEALGLGSIPVVTPEFLPPFAPDIDWGGCLVTVSEARIVDLPRILRAMSQREVKQRQKVCKALFQKTIGWVEQGENMVIDSGENAFLSSLDLWAHRIRKAQVSRKLKAELHSALFQS